MADYKAIETEYNGYVFRSRQEARWAVFFDALGIDYIYETEGYYGFNNIRYLPDFYFPEYGVYGEVKGTDEQLFSVQNKISAAIDFDSTPVSKGLLLLGPLPYPEHQSNNYDIRGCRLYWDEGICCGGFAIQSVYEVGRILFLRSFGSSSYPMIPKESSVKISINSFDERQPSRLDAALKAALSARFEFAEKASNSTTRTFEDIPDIPWD